MFKISVSIFLPFSAQKNIESLYPLVRSLKPGHMVSIIVYHHEKKKTKTRKYVLAGWSHANISI